MIVAPGRRAQPLASTGRLPSRNQGIGGGSARTSNAIRVGGLGSRLAASLTGAGVGDGLGGTDRAAGTSAGDGRENGGGSARVSWTSGRAAAGLPQSHPHSQRSKA